MSRILSNNNKMIKFYFFMISFILFLNLPEIESQGRDDLVFKLEVIGARWEGFGGPCPPSEILTEPCTWDARYYSDLYFRLIYNGNIACNICNLLIWHELNVKNVIYNHTGPINIPTPPYILKKGYFYEFKVEGGFYSQYYGNITLEITTLELGKFIISTWYNDRTLLSIITSWKPLTPIKKITFSTGILMISLLLFGIRKMKNRTK